MFNKAILITCSATLALTGLYFGTSSDSGSKTVWGSTNNAIDESHIIAGNYDHYDKKKRHRRDKHKDDICEIKKCDIELVKKADPEVIRKQTLTPSCDILGKPISLTFRYTGGGCDASDNGQKKHECSGEIGEGAVTVEAFKDEKKKSKDQLNVSPTLVQPGDEFTLTPPDGKDKFKSSTTIFLSNNGGEEINEIHTSCSQPLNIGDVYGSLTLVGFNDQKAESSTVTYTYEFTNNGPKKLKNFVLSDDKLGKIADYISIDPGETLVFTKQAEIMETTTNTAFVRGIIPHTDEMCEASDTVTVKVDTDGNGNTICPLKGSKLEKKKVMALELLYNGESCADSDNLQSDKKSDCTGDANFDSEVFVIVNDKEDSLSGKVFFSGSVALNETFEAVADKDKLSSNTYVHIFDSAGGTLLQRIQIHTSCSAPLFIGDQFGSIVIQGFTESP